MRESSYIYVLGEFADSLRKIGDEAKARGVRFSLLLDKRIGAELNIRKESAAKAILLLSGVAAIAEAEQSLYALAYLNISPDGEPELQFDVIDSSRSLYDYDSLSMECEGAQCRLEVDLQEDLGHKYRLLLACEDGMQKPQKVLNLLVAEDNVTNQMLISVILEEIGVDFTLVQNGAQALEEVQKESYSLILMDIDMPVMDGKEAARKIRESGSAIPIVALSANTREEELASYYAAGMNGFVAKPYNLDQIREAIEQFALQE